MTASLLALYPPSVLWLMVIIVGLVIGSFLNVCIVRLPLGESVVRPRSQCPTCKTGIRWYDNIPLLSWIVLGGKCRGCSSPISMRYPFIEALAAAAAAGLWWVYGPDVRFLIALPFTLAMIVLFFTDYDHQLLPDAVTLSGFMAGLAVAWINPFLPGEDWNRVWLSLAGAALGSGLLWGVGAVYGRLRGVEAMGMGDVKMMALVGAFVGPGGVLFTVFAASVAGAVVGLSLIPLRGRQLQDALPFGCFLAPAALAALFVGRAAIAAYLGIVFPEP